MLRDVKRAKPALPVVIFTSYATVGSAVQAMKLGGADYLEKPFTPEQLLKPVNSALEVARTQEPEEQAIAHKEVLLTVIDRAAADMEFFIDLMEKAADALDSFELTSSEKLALLTGDITWIEEQVGPLSREQRRWLDLRRSTEIW